MKNKKSLIAILAILIIAVVGVTFAYFQTTGTFENVFQTGTYRLVTTEVFESPDNWAPGQEIPKTITTTNEGTIPAAVRVSYTEQWLDSEENDITSIVEEGSAIISFDNTDDWIEEDGYYYYKYILNPKQTTSSFIKSVTLNEDLDEVSCTTEGTRQVCESTNPALHAKYILTITKETIEAGKYSEWNSSVELIEKPQVVTILSGTKGNLQPGDVVGIGDTEDFYVISSDNSENGKTILLAKYDLLVGKIIEDYSVINEIQPSDPGYGLQSIEATGYIGEDYKGSIRFSDTQYWLDGDNLKDKYKNNEDIYYNTSPSEIWNKYYINATTGERAYPYVYDENSVLYPYVNDYVSKLIEVGAPSTITGRLASLEEILSIENVQVDGNSIVCNGSNFWLGSLAYPDNLSSASTTYDSVSTSFYYNSDINVGLRPVIEIPTSEIN